MYVRTYVCMYVCMHVRMHVRMYVCMYVCMHAHTYVCMYVRRYVRVYLRTCVLMYVRMYVCTYVCMYVLSPQSLLSMEVDPERCDPITHQAHGYVSLWLPHKARHTTHSQAVTRQFHSAHCRRFQSERVNATAKSLSVHTQVSFWLSGPRFRLDRTRIKAGIHLCSFCAACK